MTEKTAAEKSASLSAAVCLFIACQVFLTTQKITHLSYT